MIHITVAGTEIYGKLDTKLTSGSVGREVEFTFDDKWEGLIKTAVFRVGDDCRSYYMGENNKCEFPWELLTHSKVGQLIHIGVCGMREEEIVFPTMYTYIGELQEGADANADPSVKHSPELVEQLISIAENAQDAAQSVRDDADRGLFNGAPGEKGDKGDKGDTGAIKLIPITNFPEDNIDESAIYLKPISNWIGGTGAWINGPTTVTTESFGEIVTGIKYFRVVLKRQDNKDFTAKEAESSIAFIANDNEIITPKFTKGTIDSGTIHDGVSNRAYTTDLHFATKYRAVNLASGWSMWAHFYTGDKFEEYVYIDGIWELIGGSSVEINLDEYVKKTDYANKTNFGVIKVCDGDYGVGHNTAAGLYLACATTIQIDKKENQYRPITPKNIDQVVKVGMTTNTQEWTEEDKSAARELIGAVGSEDYATWSVGGVVKTSNTYGTGVTTNGTLLASAKSLDEYKNGTTALFISKGTLENIKNNYVKEGLTTNTVTLTDEEKASACEWLGVNVLVGDIETALDNIIAIQENLIGGGNV